MNRKMLRDRREAPRDDGKARWAMLVEDVSGIDGDIERLVQLYQAKHGYSRHQASAELVQRLSSFAGAGAAFGDDYGCS